MEGLSPYLLVPLVAWALSQLLKYVLQGIRSNSLHDLSLLYKSGDMPSSHSALMLSLLTTIGIKDGVGSTAFGIVAVLTVIVLYDAVNVRRAVGEQGLVLKEIAKASKHKTNFYMAKGHTLTEVSVGSLLGVLVAIIVLQFL